MTSKQPVLSVENLTIRVGVNELVKRISFEIQRGEIFALVGESGSGKSLTSLAIMRLLPEALDIADGKVLLNEQSLFTLPENRMQRIRGQQVAMIFQEPMVAFDPVYTVGRQITETIRRHENVSAPEARQRALNLFERVQIPSPERRLKALPHELSGGMRQRAMIALALACNPRVLLADEPTTALDATVQIQILLLLRELRRELGMAVIFVTHDIGVAMEIADRIAVMYAGRFVEIGPVKEIVRNPRHPYTRGLLSSTVQGSLRGQRLEAIPGSPPDMAQLATGCAFAPRCRHVLPACEGEVPAETWLTSDHMIRCLLQNGAS